jgi:hypothetical protein
MRGGRLALRSLRDRFVAKIEKKMGRLDSSSRPILFGQSL